MSETAKSFIRPSSSSHAVITKRNGWHSHQSIKGPGYWKMNVSLLQDENYLNELKSNFPEWKTTGTNNLSNKRSIWDWLKYKIRNHAISYSKQKARERHARDKLLQTTVLMKKQQRDMKKIH